VSRRELRNRVERLAGAFESRVNTSATHPLIAAAALEAIDATTPPDWDGAEGLHPDALAALRRVEREMEAAIKRGRGEELLAEIRARYKQTEASQ
jgi:hypothetical protein